MKTHRMYRSSEYQSWKSMKTRCLNSNSSRYVDYGARGITVCDQWLKFENFYTDMGPRPAGLTIDRIDNDGNYGPGNCRWATRSEQQRNTRICKTNTSGITGVCHLKNDKWQSFIGVNGKQLALYDGPSFQIAVEKREAAERLYW